MESVNAGRILHRLGSALTNGVADCCGVVSPYSDILFAQPDHRLMHRCGTIIRCWWHQSIENSPSFLATNYRIFDKSTTFTAFLRSRDASRWGTLMPHGESLPDNRLVSFDYVAMSRRRWAALAEQPGRQAQLAVQFESITGDEVQMSIAPVVLYRNTGARVYLEAPSIVFLSGVVFAVAAPQALINIEIIS